MNPSSQIFLEYTQRNQTIRTSYDCTLQANGTKLTKLLHAKNIALTILWQDLPSDTVYSKIDAVEIYELSIGQFLKAVRTANCFRTSYVDYTPFEPTFEPISKLDLIYLYNTKLKKIIDCAAKDFEIKILHEIVPLTDIDKQTIQEIAKETGTEWKMPYMECMDYALYHLRLPRTVDYVVGKISDEEYRAVKINQLLKKEFILVDKQQEGDLIVYLDDELIPVHMGVLKDPCTVISKWGPHMPSILEHSIYHFPQGSSFVIYRKKDTALCK